MIHELVAELLQTKIAFKIVRSIKMKLEFVIIWEKNWDNGQDNAMVRKRWEDF